MLVDVVLRYCCGLIHPKAPSQSGPAPVPAACGEIHPHSEALLFRSDVVETIHLQVDTTRIDMTARAQHETILHTSPSQKI